MTKEEIDIVVPQTLDTADEKALGVLRSNCASTNEVLLADAIRELVSALRDAFGYA